MTEFADMPARIAALHPGDHAGETEGCEVCWLVGELDATKTRAYEDLLQCERDALEETERLAEKIVVLQQERDAADRARISAAKNERQWCDEATELERERAGLLARAEQAEAALREAREGFREAYEYGCEWPIGTDDEPQEQRGMSRDTFIRNMEFYGEKIDAALASPGDPEEPT